MVAISMVVSPSEDCYHSHPPLLLVYYYYIAGELINKVAMASLSINEHVAVCSQYGMSAVNISTDSVKCSVWSKFEQSVLSDFFNL